MTDIIIDLNAWKNFVPQLRWIENGYTIKTAITTAETIAIDTPEDLEKAMHYLELKNE